MCSPKVLATIIGSIYALFVYLLFSDSLYYAENTRAFILPILTFAYFCNVRKRSLYFILFLLLYSISDLMVIISDKLDYDFDYYAGNILYILAYISLAIEIGKNISFGYIFKNYLFSILVLFLLNFYISYILSQVINPFLSFSSDYVLEIVYNISMLMVLSLAVLNYFYYSNSKKAFYLLIGGICIVFSEILSVAYMYISNQNLLKFFTVTLNFIGLYFMYEQAKLRYVKRENVMY